MTRLLRPLSTRIFLGSAVLAVSSILAAVWFINRTVTAQVEREVERSLVEADTLVSEYRQLTLTQLTQSARLIADLPKFKAAVELDDPPTVTPLAEDYRRQLGADVFLVVGRRGRALAQIGAGEIPSVARGDGRGVAGTARVSFLPVVGGVLQLVTVPIWIDPAAPDVLGTLSVGTVLDSEFASRIKQLTASDIVFAWRGQVRAGTLEEGLSGELTRALTEGDLRRVSLGGIAYDAFVRPLADADAPADLLAAPAASGATVVVLRSRSEGLRPLRALHVALGAIALVAVLAATVLSYFVARTVTRPIRLITASMRQVAASGDPSGKLAVVPSSRWGDEDAHVLAATLNTMTASISRFQQEAAQRERLSALGRLSTVVAHEIRNPLTIIKAAVRTLRRANGDQGAAATALADIDEEVGRLNGLVNGVLDFARPIRFTLAPARLSDLCRDAAQASEVAMPGAACALRLDPAADEIVTDAERLRQALLNLLSNARQAVASLGENGRDGAADVELVTEVAAAGQVRVIVRDRGPGLDPATLARVFDPFFTTKPAGTGVGLAITRNIVEGLGGTIHVSSRAGVGTDVTLDLPRTAGPGGPPS